MSGIYIHIPFCKQACSYCDFYFVTRNSQREQFVKRLLDEIEQYSGTKYLEEPVRTLYFGGGTPSLLDPGHLHSIYRRLDQTFDLQLEEWTVEMNPDDVNKDYLSDVRKLGVNRASMGVQSFNPELLSFMHRAHDRDEALKCLELLRCSGFHTYTVDLIYGNPGQSLSGLGQDIDRLLAFEPPHVSAYSLTVEPGTRLGKQVELGRIDPAEDDMVADHFDLINERFLEHGIRRYEVSNYSRPGHEALHNSHYWNHENYIGMGPGAHSFWWDEEAVRWTCKADLRAYLQEDLEESVVEKERLNQKQLAEERIMMGLRTRRGVGLKELENCYGYVLNDRQRDYVSKKCKEAKMEYGESLVLTDEGIKIADAIILDLVTLH